MGFKEAVQEGGFIRANFQLGVSAVAYLIACLGPLWGLGWGSPALAPWSAFILMLLFVAAWRLFSPGGKYPKTDFAFIVPIVLSLNLFGALIGQGGVWLRPMDFLLVALCALYYSVWFNLGVAGLVMALEGANHALGSGAGGVESAVGLGVHAAYLAACALVLGRLFQAEHKKKLKAANEVRRLRDGAKNIEPAGSLDPSISSISPDGRMGRLVESADALDLKLAALLDTALAAIPSRDAVMFMTGDDEGSVYVRVSAGEGYAQEDAVIHAGQGLIGWVVREKQPVLASSKPSGLGYLQKEDDVRSLIAAPILNGGTIEGVIALDSTEEDAYTSSDRDTLARVADIAVYLLQGTREYNQAELDARNFAALHRISSEMSASLDIKAILDRLAAVCHEVVPYDQFTVSFVEGGDKLSFHTFVGYEGVKLPKGPVPLAGSLMDWIVKNHQPLSFTDLDRQTGQPPVFPVKELQIGARSFLGVPLVAQDKTIGVITVSFRQPGAISAYQQHMMSIIANQVAVNIANAKLHHIMRKMATTDGLTGLINHRHFQEKADERFARSTRFPEPISVLLMDIDHFKKVNDTYGHPIGDAVLKQLSGILRDTVRDIDMPARYGGEEFIVLLENTDGAGAVTMGERLRKAVEKSSFKFGDVTVPVTISVGAASFPADGKDKKEIIERSDQALYHAKRTGRNRVSTYTTAKKAGAIKND